MKRSKASEIEKYFAEILILVEQGTAWRTISEILKKNHHIDIEHSYLRRKWIEIKVTNEAEEEIEFREKLRGFMTVQPIMTEVEVRTKVYKDLADKKERLLKQEQDKLRGLEEVKTELERIIKMNRRHMGKDLYRRLMEITKGKKGKE